MDFSIMAIFAASALQDVGFTCKTGLVAHGRRKMAMMVDVFAMLADALCKSLIAVNVIRGGLSTETVLSFAALAGGGALGTGLGMVLSAFLEKRFGGRVPARIEQIGTVIKP